MTFLITAFVLVPMGGGLKKLMFSGNGLYHHTLCPVLSVLSYLLWEPHASIFLLVLGNLCHRNRLRKRVQRISRTAVPFRKWIISSVFYFFSR